MFFFRNFDGSIDWFAACMEFFFLLMVLILLFFVYDVFFRKPKITEGKVIHKEHHTERKQLLMIPIVMSNGKSTTTVMTPMWITHPETWSVHIQNWDKEDEKFVEESFYLSKEAFDGIELGDWFKFNPHLHLKDRPEIREKAEEIEE